MYPRNQIEMRRVRTYLELRGRMYANMVVNVLAGGQAAIS